jgi:hypothetical protein
MRVPLNADSEVLYKSAMRMRLTRAGLLKIMQANADADAVKDLNADAVPLDNADADAVD